MDNKVLLEVQLGSSPCSCIPTFTVDIFFFSFFFLHSSRGSCCINECPGGNAGSRAGLELRSSLWWTSKNVSTARRVGERSAMTDERLLRYLPREPLAEWVTIPARPSTFLKFQLDFCRLSRKRPPVTWEQTRRLWGHLVRGQIKH